MERAVEKFKVETSKYEPLVRLSGYEKPEPNRTSDWNIDVVTFDLQTSSSDFRFRSHFLPQKKTRNTECCVYLTSLSSPRPFASLPLSTLPTERPTELPRGSVATLPLSALALAMAEPHGSPAP